MNSMHNRDDHNCFPFAAGVTTLIVPCSFKNVCSALWGERVCSVKRRGESCWTQADNTKQGRMRGPPQRTGTLRVRPKENQKSPSSGIGTGAPRSRTPPSPGRGMRAPGFPWRRPGCFCVSPGHIPALAGSTVIGMPSNRYQLLPPVERHQVQPAVVVHVVKADELRRVMPRC